jgi:hypothetical protein
MAAAASLHRVRLEQPQWQPASAAAAAAAPSSAASAAYQRAATQQGAAAEPRPLADRAQLHIQADPVITDAKRLLEFARTQKLPVPEQLERELETLVATCTPQNRDDIVDQIAALFFNWFYSLNDEQNSMLKQYLETSELGSAAAKMSALIPLSPEQKAQLEAQLAAQKSQLLPTLDAAINARKLPDPRSFYRSTRKTQDHHQREARDHSLHKLLNVNQRRAALELAKNYPYLLAGLVKKIDASFPLPRAFFEELIALSHTDAAVSFFEDDTLELLCETLVKSRHADLAESLLPRFEAKHEFVSKNFALQSLCSFYAKQGNAKKAVELAQMTRPDTNNHCYSTICRDLIQAGCVQEAFDIVNGFDPDTLESWDTWTEPLRPTYEQFMKANRLDYALPLAEKILVHVTPRIAAWQCVNLFHTLPQALRAQGNNAAAQRWEALIHQWR